jgi:hypothetical protein
MARSAALYFVEKESSRPAFEDLAEAAAAVHTTYNFSE